MNTGPNTGVAGALAVVGVVGADVVVDAAGRVVVVSLESSTMVRTPVMAA